MAIEVATIEYATSVDDVVAFNQFHMKRSRTGKQARAAWTATGAVLWFLCILGATMALNASVFSARPIGLAIGERALREESEVSSEEILYGALERVRETETHVFIYTGAAAALVVPKASVSVGELAPFVAELKRRISDAA
jgi:hypothetical protein